MTWKVCACAVIAVTSRTRRPTIPASRANAELRFCSDHVITILRFLRPAKDDMGGDVARLGGRNQLNFTLRGKDVKTEALRGVGFSSACGLADRRPEIPYRK